MSSGRHKPVNFQVRKWWERLQKKRLNALPRLPLEPVTDSFTKRTGRLEGVR
ncbi:Hypothetical protein SMAX5B_022338 [Scophthalmus maximus]|uniref:Uncharacterized protein n=1 Tax=Scophthalmus maximus TaxID=52904 RepID=A0A2U9C4I3_SCOMX|nr:Hypothetical protein SMAX5B_022338 [Scophthalmus maximus]